MFALGFRTALGRKQVPDPQHAVARADTVDTLKRLTSEGPRLDGARQPEAEAILELLHFHHAGVEDVTVRVEMNVQIPFGIREGPLQSRLVRTVDDEQIFGHGD